MCHINYRLQTSFNITQVTVVGENGQYLHASQPPELYESHKHKLSKTIRELVESKLISLTQKLIVFSKSLNNEITIKPEFK